LGTDENGPNGILDGASGLHLKSNRDVFLMSPGDNVTRVATAWGNSGKLVVEGRADFMASVGINGYFSSSFDSNEGGRISLLNPSKSATGEVKEWTIYNMTGGYLPNGLHFWKYPNSETFSGSSTFVLTDDGNTLVKGNLNVNGSNNIMPDLSVISYAGSVVPAGWQLCDGQPLVYKDKTATDPARFKRDNDGEKINTPSLYITQLYNPGDTEVWFNHAHQWNPEQGQDSSHHHIWNESSLYSHHAWHARKGDYMRINLTSVHDIVGVVIAGNHDPNLEFHTPIKFESYITTVTNPNLLKSYTGSAYSTPNIPVKFCKVNNNTHINKPTHNRYPETILFDKSIKGNFFTIKILETITDDPLFMLRIALIVRPETKSIIKQPSSS